MINRSVTNADIEAYLTPIEQRAWGALNDPDRLPLAVEALLVETIIDRRTRAEAFTPREAVIA